MKILITGNPAFNSLSKGLETALQHHELTFISRGLGHDLTDLDWIVEYTKEFDIFINSTLLPNNGQLQLLQKLHNHTSLEQIINISTTSVYWNNQTSIEYYESKLALETYSKELSNECAELGKKLRVSCIAFGTLDSARKRETSNRTLLDLDLAGYYVKMIVDSPKSLNINYISIDPIQIK